MTRHKSPLEVYCVCNWLISVHLEIMTHLSICAIKKKRKEHLSARWMNMHHQKRLAVMNIKTSPPVITPRGVWRRYWKQEVRIFSTFQHKAQSQWFCRHCIYICWSLLHRHTVLFCPKHAFASLLNWPCLKWSISVRPGLQVLRGNTVTCLFCWLLCESIWEISGSVGKLNIKIVLITLFMIWNVKGVARIDEPTENYHLRLQLHSVVGSLICLTKTFTVLVPTAFLWPLQAAVF